MGSTGSDVTAFTGFGINRVAVVQVGTAGYNVNNITFTATTGGANQALLPATKGVTQQPMHFVGSNHDAILKFLFIDALKISGGGSPRISVAGYIFNRNIGCRYQVFDISIDTAVTNFVSFEEPIGFSLSPTDVLYFTADTDINGTDIRIRFSLNEYQRS